MGRRADMSLTSDNSLPSPPVRHGRIEVGRCIGCHEIKVRRMRKLLIVTGPSEEPFRVMLPTDDGPSAARTRGRRVRTGRPAGRADRLQRSPRRLRWAYPSRAIAAVPRSLRTMLQALLPTESQDVADSHSVRREAAGEPRLRLVRDCGSSLASAARPSACADIVRDLPTQRRRAYYRRSSRVR